MVLTPSIFRIETPRLTLRCYDAADAHAVLKTIDRNEADLAAWLPWVTERPRTLQGQAQLLSEFRTKFEAAEEFVYSVWSKQGEFLGSVGLHRHVGPRALEVGYWLDAEHWGQGLGTEMVAAVCRTAFAFQRIDHLDIRVAPENFASVRIAAKLGFAYQETQPDRLRSVSRVHDMMLWRLPRLGVHPQLEGAVLRAFDATGKDVPIPS